VTTGSVVVVGAGPAGAAAAVAAAQGGERVWLVGRSSNRRAGTLEVISGRAARALAALGWHAAVVDRARACDSIVARWADDAYVERSSLLEPGGHGWIVDRSWFDPLVRTLAARAGVSCVHDMADVPSAHRRILATGKHAPSSGARRLLGPPLVALTVSWPSGAVGDLEGRLVVDATERGWWSALDDGVATAATYTTDRPHGAGVLESWRRAVLAAPAWLPRRALDGPVRVRPIRQRLQLSGSSSEVRVGDAALSVDPLSGHGLALALEGAVRHDAADYESWLSAQADAHHRARADAYRACRWRSPFWRRHARAESV
jgi:flavin-dependent dehydrogenase